ncbi:MAG: DUF6622 family protein [Halopseudomonas sp.]|uniref:DUF6622 family protein n=1 Tax=Halopseudomonas sp. TaxID=2901191 RepID=UPI0030028B3F
MITQILVHTPLWVYGLFVGLLVFGLQQTRSRNVNVFLAFLLPVGMVALSLSGIGSSFGMQLVPLAMWAFGLLSITLIGYLFLREKSVVFSPSSRSFFIPGSWVPLAVIMAIFFAKYLFAVMHALDAQVTSSTGFVVSLSLIYGLLSGYFASRAINLVCQYRAATLRCDADFS